MDKERNPEAFETEPQESPPLLSEEEINEIFRTSPGLVDDLMRSQGSMSYDNEMTIEEMGENLHELFLARLSPKEPILSQDFTNTSQTEEPSGSMTEEEPLQAEEAAPPKEKTEDESAEQFNKPLPRENRPKYLAGAESLADAGMNTPEALANALEVKFDGRLRPYSQSIWGFIAGFDETAAQTPAPDWEEIYLDRQGADSPENKQRREAYSRALKGSKGGEFGRKLSRAYTASMRKENDSFDPTINEETSEAEEALDSGGLSKDAPAERFNRPIPPEKIPGIVKAAQSAVKAGRNTPEKFAELLRRQGSSLHAVNLGIYHRG